MPAPPARRLARGRPRAHLKFAMTTRADRIESLIREHFAPVKLRVADDSRLHAGHAGASPAGETHYTVLVVSAAFQGQTRIARSRAVHALLDGEFRTGLHALALTLRTPEEQARADGA
jgi:BolA protein